MKQKILTWDSHSTKESLGLFLKNLINQGYHIDHVVPLRKDNGIWLTQAMIIVSQ